MPTRITFDKDHSVEVDASPSEVADELNRSAPSHPSIVQFEHGGRSVHVNAVLVRTVEEAPSKRAKTF